MEKKKERVIPKITAIAWLKNILDRPTWMASKEVREDLEEILRYLKAAPAPGSTRRRK